MPSIERLMIRFHEKSLADGQAWFTKIDLKYAYSQIPLHPETAKHCNFNLVSGEATGRYRFLIELYGLTDMPAEFQKALDATLVGLTNTHFSLDDIVIVSKGSQSESLESVLKCLEKLDHENIAINLEKKCHFLTSDIVWLGHHIRQTGIRPTDSKKSSLSKLKRPKMQNS